LVSNGLNKKSKIRFYQNFEFLNQKNDFS